MTTVEFLVLTVVLVLVIGYGVGVRVGMLQRDGRTPETPTLSHDPLMAATYSEREERGYAKGRDEAMAILADTDDNAAILAMMADGKIAPVFGMSGNVPHEYYRYAQHAIQSGALRVVAWDISDKSIARASLSAKRDTPRAAYLAYRSMLGPAKAICEQLDDIELARKAAVES